MPAPRGQAHKTQSRFKNFIRCGAYMVAQISQIFVIRLEITGSLGENCKSVIIEHAIGRRTGATVCQTCSLSMNAGCAAALTGYIAGKGEIFEGNYRLYVCFLHCFTPFLNLFFMVCSGEFLFRGRFPSPGYSVQSILPFRISKENYLFRLSK